MKHGRALALHHPPSDLSSVSVKTNFYTGFTRLLNYSCTVTECKQKPHCKYLGFIPLTIQVWENLLSLLIPLSIDFNFFQYISLPLP